MKKVIKIFIVQIAILFLFIFIDLFFFAGFYTSKVYIQSRGYECNAKDNSCRFTIEKKNNLTYELVFKNNSLAPKYFLNYRFEELQQNVTDTLFYSYLGRNVYPAYDFDYDIHFDCGTGVELSSINPLKNFVINKSYRQILKEFSNFYTIKNLDFLYESIPYKKYKYEEIDSLIKFKSQFILVTDSIQLEYYVPMFSFISKNKKYSSSNLFKVSLKDLFDEYAIQDSINKIPY